MSDSTKVEPVVTDAQLVLTSTPIEPKAMSTNQTPSSSVEEILESAEQLSGSKNATFKQAPKVKEPLNRRARIASRTTKPIQLAATNGNQKVKKIQKEKAPKIKASHPPFFDMITQAINKLNERSGSSRQAILKFIVSNFKVDEKSGNQYVKISLKNAVKAGTLKQVKGVGASGSFKLSDALKNNKKKSTSDEMTATKKALAKKVTAAVAAKKIFSAATVAKSKSPAKKTVKAKKNVKKQHKTAAKPVAAASSKKAAAKSKTTTKKAAKLKTKQATGAKKAKAVASTPVKKTVRTARKSC